MTPDTPPGTSLLSFTSRKWFAASAGVTGAKEDLAELLKLWK